MAFSLSRFKYISHFLSAQKFLLSNCPHYEGGGIFVLCGLLLASVQGTATTDVNQHLFKHLLTLRRTIFIQHQSVLLQLTVPYLFFALHQNLVPPELLEYFTPLNICHDYQDNEMSSTKGCFSGCVLSLYYIYTTFCLNTTLS